MDSVNDVRHVTTPDRTVAFRVSALVAAAAMLVCYLPFSGTTGLLGQIGSETGVPTSALQWVSDAFTLALAGAVLVGGALAQRFGHRRLVLGGLTLTTAGSLLGLTSGSLDGIPAVRVLTAALALAGVGGGVVMSSTLSLLAVTAPSAQDRTRAISLWAAATVVGLGAGPFLAAASAALSPAGPTWRWFYLPVVGLSVAVAYAVHAHTVDAQGDAATTSTGNIDTVGLALGAAGVVALVYGVVAGGDQGWTSAPALLGVTAGVLVLGAFLRHEHRAEAPVLNPRMFARPGFTAAGLGAGAALFTVVGVVFVLSITLAATGADGLDVAYTVGVLFSGNAAASLAAAKMQSRWGLPTVLLAGLVVGALALAFMVIGTRDLRWTTLAVPLAVLGSGLGVVIATSTALAVASVPGGQAGMAGTANNAMRQVAASLGPAVLGGVLAHRIASGVPPAEAVRACAFVLLALILCVTAAVALLLHRARITA